MDAFMIIAILCLLFGFFLTYKLIKGVVKLFVWVVEMFTDLFFRRV